MTNLLLKPAVKHRFEIFEIVKTRILQVRQVSSFASFFNL